MLVDEQKSLAQWIVRPNAGNRPQEETNDDCVAQPRKRSPKTNIQIHFPSSHFGFGVMHLAI